MRAYIKRFIHNASLAKEERISGFLRVYELENAEKEVIANEQKGQFKTVQIITKRKLFGKS